MSNHEAVTITLQVGESVDYYGAPATLIGFRDENLAEFAGTAGRFRLEGRRVGAKGFRFVI